MCPASDASDNLEELLSDEKEEPRADTGPEGQTASAAGSEQAKTAEAKGKAEKAPAKAVQAPAKRRRVWPTITLVILVLLAAAVGLGWYAYHLRERVAALNEEISNIKAQASGMQATAAKAAEELLPLVEEQIAVAKIRGAAGDAEGAKYALAIAKRYADVAERLSSGSPSSKLRELKGLIEQTERGLTAPSAAKEEAAPQSPPGTPATERKTEAMPEAPPSAPPAEAKAEEGKTQ